MRGKAVSRPSSHAGVNDDWQADATRNALDGALWLFLMLAHLGEHADECATVAHSPSDWLPHRMAWPTVAPELRNGCAVGWNSSLTSLRWDRRWNW